MASNPVKGAPVSAVLSGIQKSNEQLGALRSNQAGFNTAATPANVSNGLAQDITIPSTSTVASSPSHAQAAVAMRGPSGFGQMARPAPTQAAAASTTVYDGMVPAFMQALPAGGETVSAVPPTDVTRHANIPPSVNTAADIQRLASAHAAAVTCGASVIHQQQALQQQQQALTALIQQNTVDQQLLTAQSQKKALEQQVQHRQQQLQAIEQQLLQQQQQIQQQQQNQMPTAAKAGLFSALRAQQEEVSQFGTNDAASRTTTNAVGGSMYGLDQNAIDAILNDPTSKYHKSKFIKLISQIRNGEMIFQGDSIVPANPEDVLRAREEQKAQWREWAGGDEDDEQEEEETTGVDTSNFAAYEDYEYDPDDETKIAEQALKSTQEWIANYRAQHGLSSDGVAQDEDDDTIYLNTQDDAERMWREYTGGSTETKDAQMASMADLIKRAQERLEKGNVIEYQFETENEFAKDTNALQKGLEYMEADQLALAIRCFEAAVTQEPDNSEAWYYLGNANSQFAAAEQAQAALFRCTELDPYNLPALVLLGVSYTNSLNLVKSLEYLKLWLVRNPEYQGKVDLSGLEAYEQLYAEEVGAYYDPQNVDKALLGEVVKVFVAATKVNSSDPELWNVLGVLYHLTADYDLATEAFQNAVRLNPSDIQLWNRLGATLATNDRPLEALQAYEQALRTRPNNVRLLSNRAVAYYNARLYDDAIRASLQSLVINNEQSQMWSYLRACLFKTGRENLLDLVLEGDPNVFRPYFEF